MSREEYKIMMVKWLAEQLATPFMTLTEDEVRDMIDQAIPMAIDEARNELIDMKKSIEHL
jgi:hypothetical protein